MDGRAPPKDDEAVIGRMLAHYKIAAAIGGGGMGQLYRATDTKLGRDVALKLLPAEMASNPEMLDRFRREARAVAALNHPYIVTIHSVEETDALHFLTMELVEGQSLDGLIPEGGLEVQRILDIANALSGALAAAHEKGITHRDLKPANVMVTNDGRVKILDFGLAKFQDPTANLVDSDVATQLHTCAGMIMGTRPYMSPEQVQGHAVDHRTDIFSLGVMLYEMTTGRRPFQGHSSADLFASILRDTAPSVTDVRADLPSNLARVIKRCLEKDPQHRIQTARNVANELHEGARPLSPKEAIEPPGVSASEGSGGTRADQGFWVAVLPFKCVGGNPDLTALAEGISEEIVTGLSRFSYLRVIARSSTSRFANGALDVRAVGKEIGARYVMEGSLRQAGPVLRLSVQLVDAATGTHLWAETYNRPFDPTAIFALQDDLVPRIVSTVADWYGVLPHSMSESVQGKAADQTSPYEAVLRGFGYYRRVRPDEHAAVRAALERAVRQAPQYADAWVMLSMMYGEEHRFRFNVQADPLGRALRAAHRAADLAPANHLAHLALAQALFFRKEFPAFRSAAERAIALNPMDGSTGAYIGHLMAFAGDWERGCDVFDRARELNPHHPDWYWALPFYDAYRQGDDRRALTFVPRFSNAVNLVTHAMCAALYGQLGEREAAGKALKELLFVAPDYALIGREELGKWYPPELVARLIEGLRKAGLEVAPEEGAAVASPIADTAGRKTSTTQSIAVLPFANLSADKDQEYFSDGLAEEIINLLAQMSGLKVIARTSAFAFRGKEQDIRGIGDALGVRTILQGSVRRAGSRIRVSTQLINAVDGDHLWSERFDREMTEVFAVQDEIAATIAGALQVTLKPQAAAKPRYTPKVPAYEALLKARHFHWKVTAESMAQAKAFYEQAMALDPQFALAHALYADYLFGRTTVGMSPMREVAPVIRASAQRALELDSSLPDAQGPLGFVAATHDYDWKEAARRFTLAAPDGAAPPLSHMGFGWAYFLGSGRRKEAVEQLELAVQGDPLHLTYRALLAMGLGAAGRFSEAEKLLDQSRDLDPNFFWTYAVLAELYAARQLFVEARPIAERAFTLAPWYTPSVGVYAGVLVRLGEPDRGDEVVRTLTSGATYGGSIGWALFHTCCGDIDRAADWYEKAIEERYSMVAAFLQSAIGEPLRASPRWSKVARLMHLPGDGSS